MKHERADVELVVEPPDYEQLMAPAGTAAEEG